MNTVRRFALSVLMMLAPSVAISEDIDLFASGLASGAAADSLPNILFVLDNTSNWSRQSQKWPDDTQGQSEVRAIDATLKRLLQQGKDANVGLIEFTTAGNANQDGGYVRFDMQQLGGVESRLFSVLEQIDQGINDPDEKRNANSSYGSLASDVYAYLAGSAQSFLGEGTPIALADATGYEATYSIFDSPLTESDICSDTYVIFISNTDSNGPEVDSAENSARLASLYAELGEVPNKAFAGEAGEGILMQEYELVRNQSEAIEPIGYTQISYKNASQCTKQVNGNSEESQLIQDYCQAEGDCACSDTDSDQGLFAVTPTSALDEFRAIPSQFIDGVDFNLDDWTKFLHELGVPVVVEGAGSAADTTVRVPVTTYTVDVYNAQPNAEHSALMHSAAEQGGGYRQSATSQVELERALSRILGDIIDINTSYAAVTLPLSATNRAQAENKVFVGMFRPASQRKPRWLGNLKQYQLAKFDGQIELADVNYDRAINPQTGFAQSCATSFWTTDTSRATKAVGVSGPYFSDLGLEPSPVSECLEEFRGERSVLSDSPDGPFVEKGGAAQQIRGQVSGTRKSARKILTQSGSGLVAASGTDFAGSAVDAATLYAYLVGEEAGLKGGDLKLPDIEVSGETVYVENPALSVEEREPFEGLRPTIHGDIVHSRPLTITYGPIDQTDLTKGSDFRIFYGANDGLFRALDPTTGQEDWAFIAKEHLDGVSRLYANTPTVDYFGLDESLSTEIDASPKRYFFDGSVGSYTQYDSDNELLTGWIYPTMRRGGRQIFAFDVSPTAGPGIPPDEPQYMWKIGCPDLESDDGCTDGFSSMGQTWSTPVAGLIKADTSGSLGVATDPILVFGGGWDDCLDVDEAALSPGSCAKGNRLFVLNARTGELLEEYETEAPVVAEVSGLDIDNDGFLDFVYAADAAGNLYRLNFARVETLSDPYAESLERPDWFLSHIAASSKPTIRFFNKPTIGSIQNRVVVAIGSGDRERPLKQNYPYLESVSNRFYALIDEPYEELDEASDLDSTTGERSMLDAGQGLADGILLIDQYRGWYLDLPDRGEQVVNPAAIGGGFVFFNSFQPEGGTKGLCSDLGKSKSYQVPLFRPQNVEGVEFGQGVPIPPIIVTVKLDSGEPSCTGPQCGEGEIPNEIVTVCIGCEGFDPIEITPATNGAVREAYRAENIDRL
ncbi:MAG: PilC/PilY family type IV pilus protein [Halieaceae bacterium]